MYMYIHVYIYIHTYTLYHTSIQHYMISSLRKLYTIVWSCSASAMVEGRPSLLLRTISLLILSLLRLLDSNFTGNPLLWAWEFPPLEINIMLESNPLKSTMLAGRLAVVVVVVVILS